MTAFSRFNQERSLQVLCVVTAFSFASCQHSTLPRQLGEADMQSTYAIYSMLIEQQLSQMPKDAEVFINSTTHTEETHANCLKPINTRKYEREIASYFSANKTPHMLEHR